MKLESCAMSDLSGTTVQSKGARTLAYVARCAGSAMVAYELARVLGLPE
ncbi:MAG: hypothetical protein JOZ27_02050, partial [Caulobacteraceae bacterium]|nr:hypothetical protein [Caulobacteraceae bacterium]